MALATLKGVRAAAEKLGWPEVTFFVNHHVATQSGHISTTYSVSDIHSIPGSPEGWEDWLSRVGALSVDSPERRASLSAAQKVLHATDRWRSPPPPASPDERARAKAEKLLTAIRSARKPRPATNAAFLTENKRDFRFARLRRLGDAGLAALIALTSDDDWELRSKAASTLGATKDPRALGPLLALLRRELAHEWPADELPAVKNGRVGSVALWITNLEDPRTYVELRRLQTDDSVPARVRAERVVEIYAPEAR